MDGKTINKALNWTVKIAGMLICAPVTWLVGGELFADVQFPLLCFIVRAFTLCQYQLTSKVCSFNSPYNE